MAKLLLDVHDRNVNHHEGEGLEVEDPDCADNDVLVGNSRDSKGE